MKTIIMTIVSTLVALTFSACGSSSSSDTGTTVDTPTESFVAERTLSLGEDSNFTFDTGIYFDDVDSFSVIESKSANSRALTHTSDELNVSIVDGVLVVTTGSVDETTTYNFTVTGTEKTRVLKDMNISVEVVDSADDQPITVSSVQSDVMTISTFLLNFSDKDGMASVTLEVSDSDGVVVDTRVVTTGDDVTVINVSESFEALSPATYSVSVVAEGVIGGAGERSSFTDTYSLIVEEIVENKPNAFDFTNKYSQNLSSFVTTNTETITGLTSAVDFTTTNGTFILNGTDTGFATISVDNNDTLAVRVQTSGSYSRAVSTTVSGGGVSDAFSVSTKAAPPPPTEEETCEANGGFWDGTECHY